QVRPGEGLEPSDGDEQEAGGEAGPRGGDEHVERGVRGEGGGGAGDVLVPGAPGEHGGGGERQGHGGAARARPPVFGDLPQSPEQPSTRLVRFGALVGRRRQCPVLFYGDKSDRW